MKLYSHPHSRLSSMFQFRNPITIPASVFQFCGSVQMFAAVLFSIGLLAYPAGWGSGRVKDICGEEND